MRIEVEHVNIVRLTIKPGANAQIPVRLLRYLRIVDSCKSRLPSPTELPLRRRGHLVSGNQIYRITYLVGRIQNVYLRKPGVRIVTIDAEMPAIDRTPTNVRLNALDSRSSCV